MSKKHIRVMDPRSVIRGLQHENDVLRGDLQGLQEYIAQLQYDNKKLDRELISLQEKKRELERSHDKAVHNFTHNSRDNIFATLKYDIERLQGEKDDRDKAIADMKAEIDDLHAKYSSLAGDKLTDGNPAISDLSDPNRPQKLTEMFSMIYDNKWTEAFEKSEGDDKKIASYLLKLFKTTWEFCQDTVDKQVGQLEEALMIKRETQDGKPYAPPPRFIKSLKQMRKEMAREMLPVLNRRFKATKMDVKEEIQPYMEGCMELCWYSAICDPPLDYVFDITDQKADFRAYTKSGKNVDFVVWPAMYLNKHGPLMCKGVAQFRD